MQSSNSRRTIISASIAALVVVSAVGMAAAQVFTQGQSLDNRSDASMEYAGYEYEQVYDNVQDTQSAEYEYNHVDTPRPIRYAPPTNSDSIVVEEAVRLEFSCGWCGRTCTEITPDLTCPQVSAPEGATCQFATEVGRCQAQFLIE